MEESKTISKKVFFLNALVIAFFVSFIFFSCTKDNDVDWSEESIVEVSPNIIPVHIFGEPDVVEGILVKFDGFKEWVPYPLHFIEGFTFEEGYNYSLKVKVIHLANPPQDSYNIRCILLSVLSKTPE